MVYLHLQNILGNVFDFVEVDLVLSYLKIINNPMIDVDFVGVMRSFFGEFDIVELTEIRADNIKETYYESCLEYLKKCEEKSILNLEEKIIQNKIKIFLDNIEKYREIEKTEGVLALLNEIIFKTEYYNHYKMDPKTNITASLLKNIYEKVESIISEKQLTLSELVKYFENIKATDSGISANESILAEEDAVRIMSIHKSKGLQFPVVILAGTTKKRNIKSLSSEMISHSQLGIGLDIIDKRLSIKYPSFIKNIIKYKVRT